MKENSNGEKLNGRIAIVTGVSRLKGIGASICTALAGEGADIFFTYWTDYDKQMPWGADRKEPFRLQKEIQDLGVRCECMEIDLSNPNSPVEVLNEVEKTLGEPFILVNNACHSVNDGYKALDYISLDNHYVINVRATTLLSVEFVRRFSKGFGGRIINVTSGQSKGAMVGEIAYATTKGAVDALTLTLSAEVAHKGITVNAVNPGPTDTGWMTDEIQQKLLPRFPMGRVGQPRDAARLIAFLASDDAEWITGQVIHSEGGFMR
ncbi:SDR family oxidoreductase [Fodinisporobacter ferrooxydans]|uniref:SDR family oxidoreductase n=1 Tax=Fodinisporobacter ferrooxydans TaxID=2901836 RepID=A0ABY4CI52_9BACL|nr:SDR family oxidoreductase [Alicyclobacillaceae bacterium MYW30-H2]